MSGIYIKGIPTPERCKGCRDCRIVYANGGWSFYGCYHDPYHGKWVADIQDCPRGEEAEK